MTVGLSLQLVVLSFSRYFPSFIQILLHDKILFYQFFFIFIPVSDTNTDVASKNATENLQHMR